MGIHVLSRAFSQILAVKKIDMIELTLNEEDEFLDVIWSISRLKHRHISTLLGYCVEQGQHVLVYEYAKNGSLDDVLFSPVSKCKDLSWKARLRIALGVAYALEYVQIFLSFQGSFLNFRTFISWVSSIKSKRIT